MPRSYEELRNQSTKIFVDGAWSVRLGKMHLDVLPAGGHRISEVSAFRYVALNPISAKLVDKVENWPWSSAGAHIAGLASKAWSKAQEHARAKR
jgi:hypothetical protein